MKLVITREYGNLSVTTGKLTVSGTKFYCDTLEKACEKSPSFSPERHALRAGQYKFSTYCDTTFGSFPCIKGINRGHTYRFVCKTSADNLAKGEISVGKLTDSVFEMQIIKKVGKWLSENVALRKELLDRIKKPELCEVEIRYSRDFIFEFIHSDDVKTDEEQDDEDIDDDDFDEEDF